MIESKITIAKCEHPNLRTFTFADGKKITMCPGQRQVTDEAGKPLWLEPCTDGDENRRKVLAPRSVRY